MLEKIEQLAQQARADLAADADADALEQFRIKYLGSKGAVKQLMGLIKDVHIDLKREFGQKANAARQEVEQAFETRKTNLGSAASASLGSRSKPAIDITEPGLPPTL